MAFKNAAMPAMSVRPINTSVTAVREDLKFLNAEGERTRTKASVGKQMKHRCTHMKTSKSLECNFPSLSRSAIRA